MSEDAVMSDGFLNEKPLSDYEEIWSTATETEHHPANNSTNNSKSSPQRRWAQLKYVVLISLLLAAVIALAVLLGIRGSNDDSHDAQAAQNETSTTTTDTTDPPTTMPTTSSEPTTTPMPTSSSPTTSQSPSSTPSTTRAPTGAPSTAPPSPFPTFEVLESRHVVQWGSAVASCDFEETPPVTLSCSNQGWLIWNEQESIRIQECTKNGPDEMVCTKVPFDPVVAGEDNAGDGLVSFSCVGSPWQLTATASLSTTKAILCDGYMGSSDLINYKYGGEAIQYLLLQRLCYYVDGKMQPNRGYPCLQGQSGETNDGVPFCFSFESCDATLSCPPVSDCTGATNCTVALSAVAVSDADEQVECRFPR